MANRNIDSYIAGLNYDPQVLLSVVPDGTTSSSPDKIREGISNGVIICTKTQHKLNKNLSEVAILSPTAGVVFPGALVLADENLTDGHPTPVALPRAPATLSVDLPGLANSAGTVIPNNSGVQTYLNAKLEEWNKLSESQGYRNAARSTLNVTKSYSSQQVSLDLGFSAKWAAGSASAQIGASSTTERSVLVACYKQVFYTITMDTPATPSSVFDKEVTLEQVQRAFTAQSPPAYVRCVDYGRILMVKMETSSVDTAVNLKGAFEQATSCGVTVGGDLKTKYEEILQNATFTVVALGGGAGAPAKIFSGAVEGQLQGLQEYITNYSIYRRDNPGVPIAYQVAFLKDSQFALLGFTTDYTETECVRYPNAFVKVHHSGAYIAKFHVSWVEPDSQGEYTQRKNWNSGKQTAGYSHQIDMPGDAQNVKIEAQAMTGLAWSPWGEIMNVSLPAPDRKCYRATGTTLDRHYKVEKC